MLQAASKAMCLLLLPLTCDGWVCAAYTLHADDSVRQAATDVISRVLHALPQMRSGLIKGMAVCAADIPSELSDVSI